MKAEKRSGLAQAFLAASASNDVGPKDVEARSRCVLGTLAGIALAYPVGFVLLIFTPKALAGPAAVLMIVLCFVSRFWSRHALAAAPRHGRTVFFTAAATAALPLLAWLLVGNWLAGLWPIFRFPWH